MLRKGKAAFTLIEILVVLGILMLLAAILLPAFSRVRDSGRRTACQSNLKQIGMALNQYTQDWDEILAADWYATAGTPDKTDWASAPDPQYKWMDAIYPYTKSEQIFTCPAATGIRARPWVYYKHLTVPQTDDYGSYVMLHGYGPSNTGLSPAVSHPHTLSGAFPVNIARAESPTTTAWVTDGESGNYANTFYAQCTDTRDLDETEARHLSTLNVLYLDGHVKAVREDALNKRNEAGVISAVTLAED